MTYLDREAQYRAHYPVPVKPVLEAIERWLVEEAERSGWRRGCDNEGKASPLTKLAQRADMKDASCQRALSRFRRETSRMSMSMAERFINATYGDELWDTPALRRFRPQVKRFDRSWMREEERERPLVWAKRVAMSMTKLELRSIAQALDLEAFLDVDDSTAARPPRQRREVTRFDPYPYAKLGQPFGARARGERAA